DSYVVLTMDQVDALLNQYLDLRPELDGSAFRRGFLEQTVQRKLKDSGRFVYIDRVKNDPGYLQYINDSLGYVRDALERLPHLADLRALLPQLDPEAFE
ncbi:MAG: aminoglycoside/choline kinase family phosphotransferase, partial [Myxococcota bacterium]